jgi:hypothetical protein
MPPIVREARTVQLIKPGAELVKAMVPDHINVPTSQGIARPSGTSVDVERLMSPEPKQPEQPAKQGYDPDNRKSMDRLIDSTGSNQ